MNDDDLPPGEFEKNLVTVRGTDPDAFRPIPPDVIERLGALARELREVKDRPENRTTVTITDDP